MVKVARILCPVDFSETSRHAFEYAMLLAGKCRAELVLLHVLEETPLPTAFGTVPQVEVLDQVKRSALAQLEQLAARAATGAPVRFELVSGQTHKTILRIAEENDFDLIVMGTHGRRGLDRAFFGSDAERVIRRAPCPVLIVRLPEVAVQDSGARK